MRPGKEDDPAYAGKRTSKVLTLKSCWDHPCARGEKSLMLNTDGNIKGSPPHTRGKAVLLRKKFQRGRITPAHAGKRAWSRTTYCSARDHPRARGEKKASSSRIGCTVGSPPRTRGKD